MKVYFIGNRYDGCYFVRCLLPMTANGWDGHKTGLTSPAVSNEQMFAGAMAADVVVFQRPDDPKKVEVVKLLQQAGKKVVFDNDDTYLPNSGVPTQMYGKKSAEILESMNTNLHEFARRADMVTVSTPFLAKEYEGINDKVVVLPNCVDPFDWDEPIPNDTEKVRIGIVGSSAANRDYEPIIPLLERYSSDERVQLVLFGLPRLSEATEIAYKAYSEEIEFWKQYNVEHHTFVPMYQYFSKLRDLKLDILLIPRHESYFNRAKSNLKFLEASMLKVPVIAQGFPDGLSPYQKPEDAAHMVIATDPDSWIRETEALITDEARRKEMGERAHEYVLATYSIEANAHLWAKAYKSI